MNSDEIILRRASAIKLLRSIEEDLVKMMSGAGGIGLIKIQAKSNDQSGWNPCVQFCDDRDDVKSEIFSMACQEINAMFNNIKRHLREIADGKTTLLGKPQPPLEARFFAPKQDDEDEYDEDE